MRNALHLWMPVVFCALLLVAQVLVLTARHEYPIALTFGSAAAASAPARTATPAMADVGPSAAVARITAMVAGIDSADDSNDGVSSSSSSSSSKMPSARKESMRKAESGLRVAEATARRCKIEDASASDQHAVCARAFQTAFDKLTGGKWSPANSKGGTAVHDHGASNWQSWISQDRDMVSPAIEATYLPGYLGYRYESFLYPLLEVIL